MLQSILSVDYFISKYINISSKKKKKKNQGVLQNLYTQCNIASKLLKVVVVIEPLFKRDKDLSFASTISIK